MNPPTPGGSVRVRVARAASSLLGGGFRRAVSAIGGVGVGVVVVVVVALALRRGLPSEALQEAHPRAEHRAQTPFTLRVAASDDGRRRARDGDGVGAEEARIAFVLGGDDGKEILESREIRARRRATHLAGGLSYDDGNAPPPGGLPLGVLGMAPRPRRVSRAGCGRLRGAPLLGRCRKSVHLKYPTTKRSFLIGAKGQIEREKRLGLSTDRCTGAGHDETGSRGFIMIAALAAGRRNKKTSRDSIDPHSTRARCPVDNATGSSTRARRRRSRSREDAVSVADGNRTERRRRLLSRGRSEGATRFLLRPLFREFTTFARVERRTRLIRPRGLVAIERPRSWSTRDGRP